uniref:Receptor-type tyrosine-protein phosphatase H n=1 Tax=Schistocephalus solidus TaxID=70667 RepID=A0A0V0JCY8_SCHSO
MTVMNSTQKKLTAEVQSAHSIRLSWQAANKSDSSPQLYLIACPSMGQYGLRTFETSYIIDNLRPSTTYWCILHSVATSGYCYQPGVEISARTWDSDELNPRKVTAEVKRARSIRLTWHPAEKSDSHPQLYVIACPATEQFIFRTNRTLYIIRKLRPGTTYWCIIHSVSTSGYCHQPGVAITARTWDSVARNPRKLTVMVKNETSVRLTWQAVKKSDRQSALYTIVVTSDTGKSFTTLDTSYVVTNLNSSTTYKFKVFSTSSDGAFYQPGVATYVAAWKKAPKKLKRNKTQKNSG